jgi:peptide chain release factor subunit 1
LLREARLAEKVVTEKAKGHAAVLGLDDTLDAIREGRVQTLLIRDGYRAAGYVCAGCGYITIQELKTCPFCGAEFQKIPDAAEMAVRQVMQFGGDVEVIHQDQPFGQAENIGALLRF